MQSTYTHNPAEDILTVAEAASAVGVHTDTLRRWANAGKVSCFRTPTGHRRFRRADIDAIKADPALAGSQPPPSP